MVTAKLQLVRSTAALVLALATLCVGAQPSAAIGGREIPLPELLRRIRASATTDELASVAPLAYLAERDFPASLTHC